MNISDQFSRRISVPITEIPLEQFDPKFHYLYQGHVLPRQNCDELPDDGSAAARVQVAIQHISDDQIDTRFHYLFNGAVLHRQNAEAVRSPKSRLQPPVARRSADEVAAWSE